MSDRRIEYKSVRYRAITVEEAELSYSADAALYTGTGWVIAAIGWDPQADRPTLVATYARFEEPSATDLLDTTWSIYGLLLLLASPVVIAILLLGLQ